VEGPWDKHPAAVVWSSQRGMTMHWYDVMLLIGYWLLTVAYSAKVLDLMR
jgi:hypothetical protein